MKLKNIMKITITILIAAFILLIFNYSFSINNCLAQWQPEVRVNNAPAPSINAQTKIGTGLYSSGQDSLLFDGNSSLIIAGNGCKVKVTHVGGIAIGTRCVSKIYNTCGEKDTAEECKVGQIFPDDKLKAGDKISTGPNGYLSIMLSDGKTINLAPNTTISINSNYCDNNFKTQVQLDEGLISVNAKPNKM